MTSARTLRRVCIYCGSSPSVDRVYLDTAHAVGRDLAARGIGIVYGGASIGSMGAVANAALAAGGEVIGVIPAKLMDREIGHRGLTELFVVDGMHARKAKMSELSDAFIALPGGWGTLDELFEAITWTQLNYHAKPVGVLNVDGYYDPLLLFAEHAVAKGFVRAIHRPLLQSATTLDALLAQLENVELPSSWIDKLTPA